MMTPKEGQAIPAMTFRTRKDGDWSEVSTEELFNGQTVVVFSLPGAFTPTCSAEHVPGYNQAAPKLKAAGVDRILCVSVNDPFVMAAWAKDQAAEHVEFIPDGNGDFTRAMGAMVDKRDLNFGERSWRYSMLVRDGIVDKMFIEPQEPGDPFHVSDAETMLAYLNPEQAQEDRVAVFTKPGCSHCVRAKRLLESKGVVYEEVSVGGDGVSFEALMATTGQRTLPQVFINGRLIGGADQLAERLK